MTMPETDSPDAASAPERIAKRRARRAVLPARCRALDRRGAGRGQRRDPDPPGVTVTGDSDIRVDGKPCPNLEPAAALALPQAGSGWSRRHRDEKGRQTVFHALPAGCRG